MKKIEEIPEPTGGHPYRVRFYYAEKRDDHMLPFEIRKEVFFSGNKKGQHKLIEKEFRKKYNHLKPNIVSVEYYG